MLARAAEMVLAQFEGRYLLLSGPPELRSAFIHNLSKDAQRCLGGEFAVDVHAGPAEVAAAAQPAQRAIEEREEFTTVRQLIDAGPEASTWGVGPTLDALRPRRVRTLVVDDTFCQGGVRCGSCAGLWEAISGNCPACGATTIEAVDDVVEMAIEQALEQRARLELVRSPAAQRLMTKRGSMAALLRW